MTSVHVPKEAQIERIYQQLENCAPHNDELALAEARRESDYFYHPQGLRSANLLTAMDVTQDAKISMEQPHVMGWVIAMGSYPAGTHNTLQAAILTPSGRICIAKEVPLDAEQFPVGTSQVKLLHQLRKARGLQRQSYEQSQDLFYRYRRPLLTFVRTKLRESL